MASTQPNRFLDVTRADGVVRELRVIEGQLFVCQGCCCGQTERGFPAVPLDEYKRQWKERGLRLRIHLTVTGCLGPCPLANVILILFGGETIWLHSINDADAVSTVFDYLEAMLDAGRYVPPGGALAARHFNRHVFDSASPGEWRAEKRTEAKS
ncbi:MAG: (2Fe-2S) ferredoxin domain-containing protein [Chloracidobacterium sp.]|uniref:(2Fe-2S) ferredoxin domain-containing protein n=1 Tax=Chloracidobacterium validum TaxID=2821543 RepID=A0ABX8B8X8_9BACT|nr:(2Fe-2S) ferredoxin domain-containing protein [Chloracidobacterium validum]QUW02095.1 (2Fe-2S) ferredoxin domain-containing protein [Chloracidobacterium validum]